MIKVLIIGGGFGGLTVLDKLSRASGKLDIAIIDKKKVSSFLPMLPDVIGRGVNPEFLSCDIEDFAKKRGARFINDTVTGVDLAKREVATTAGRLGYDYLVVASGSETNFYGQDWIKKCAYKLDDVDDAARLKDALRQNAFKAIIISGGGYTGVEVATNVRRFLIESGRDADVVIVERAPALLGALPQRLKDYTIANLAELGIRALVNTTVTSAEGSRISFSSGEILENSMLIWAAGVKTDDFIQKLLVEKTGQGRLKVDEYLRIDQRCFVIGDAANFVYKDKPIRMAVQFSIFEGACAASNIMRDIRKKPLEKYRPIDLGYVVPMANNKSCGIVMGVFISGAMATFLHYLMCIYRSFSLRNKIGLIRDLLRRQGAS